MARRITKNEITRFEKGFTKSAGCWEWQKARHTYGGYGSFDLFGLTHKAHRASYLIYKGPIPKGKMVCHSCDNPPCVNPKHLWLGDHKSNARDAVKKGRKLGFRGEEHPNSRLTSEDIFYIKDLHKSGFNCNLLAKHYDVSYSHMRNILAGKSWNYPHSTQLT